MKSSKKKSGNFLTFYLILMITVGILGLVCVWLADAKTLFRPEDWDQNFMSDLIKTFGVSRQDIPVMSMILVAAIYFSVILGSVIFFLTLRVKRAFKAKGHGFWGWFFFFLMPIVAAAIPVGTAFGVYSYVKEEGVPIVGPVKYFLIGGGMIGLITVLALIAAYLLSCAFRIGSSKVVVDGVGEGGLLGAGGTATVEEEKEEDKTSGEIFPDLIRIDEQFANVEIVPITDDPPCTLPEFVERFRAYLCVKQELYYEHRMLRSFLAGLATSRLIILEGLSGTGKSSLPRWFAEFVGSKTFFAPVQSTWRDRTDVLGFYNDFSYVFKETDFLKRLYQSSYTHNNFNLMVLDEMNLSRIEYYFADFLSILEYPPEDWRVPLMTALDPEKSPKNVKNGAVLIPTNTWFVGTANKDDSTFTITDKVYDRAVVLDFKDRNAPFETDVDPEPITMTPGQLQKLFQEAIKTEEFRLTQEELDKFVELAEFVYDTFEIRFGNRIMNQISAFVPAYVGLGGTKEEALDIMFARKVLHKLEGRFEDYIKDGLIRFQKKLDQVYGKGIFLETEELIKQMLKKLV